jgi:excisionase family DNA binding protein
LTHRTRQSTPDTGGKSVEQKYYTVDEVAERWSVSRQTVYRDVRDGHLKSLKIRNVMRIPEKWLLEYEKQMEQKNKNPDQDG